MRPALLSAMWGVGWGRWEGCIKVHDGCSYESSCYLQIKIKIKHLWVIACQCDQVEFLAMTIIEYVGSMLASRDAGLCG
ncbi:hypothetical protein PAXRUDRAFT_833351 [Paxillus rubicundulus Ve08.2h10]|uniref:Unplaced genomic scaffold scaffold_1123, whole genome shotgun sequence n=1 Tax=Paxillus rubicundulus Ve08.2h10 TaxID=930991 RepID=A0A0D0DPC1_9AGAM|nr:hypothetical protein PAXRUDRAFT_833351 [Paxillus rubicundulus Ve08.2h10]